MTISAKFKTLLTVVLLSSTAAANADESDNQNDFPVLEGPYLGQTPPGLTPEVFAPGIVSKELRDWTGSFTPDMKEYYFNRYDSKKGKRTTIVFKSKNGRWHKTILGPRMGGSISPDGKTMHAGKRYRERTDDGWSELKSLGSSFEDIRIMTLTASIKGTYVFDEIGTNGNGLLRYSRLVNGKRDAPKPFSSAINTGTWTAHPFIAPDESYIIWDSKNAGGYGDADLYISFRQPDGSWGAAVNFGDKINTEGPDSGGFVSPDGKYLFFNRKIGPEDSDTYWVDAKIIDTLRPNSKGSDLPVLEGLYLGQTPPGLTAEPFAPGIISKDGWELEGVFAPDMKEFYYTVNYNEYTNSSAEGFKPTVIGYRQENNVWKKHIEFRRRGEISFSPDGRRMHMAKGYKDRIGDTWSERKSLGPMFDREDWGIMRLTASAKGTYVFDDYKSGDVIRISTLKDGKRQEPKKMSAAVNSGTFTAHPFIAPDESYLIFDSKREGNYGDSDLYISFRQEDASWGPAINMGDKVNSDKWDAYASVTPDGKYILFNRRIDDGSSNDNMNVDIYWVDARVIDTLRPEIQSKDQGR